MHILADGYSIGGWLMVTVGQLAESIGATLAPELVQQSVGALQCSTSLRSTTSLTISLYTVLLLLQSGQLSHSINTSKSSPLLLLLLLLLLCLSPNLVLLESSELAASQMALASDPNYSLNSAAAKLKSPY